MADPSTYPEQRFAEPIVYRRISGYAIAGFAVAMAFVLLLLGVALLGLKSRTPVLLPIWIEALAIAAAALSLTAILQIRRSEGVLAGLRLAQLGCWMSVLAGLIYGAYYSATYFAIRKQSDDFLQVWFEKLRQGRLNSAFLDGMPPGVRLTANPDDERDMNIRFNQPQPGRGGAPAQKGPLDTFREHEVVRVIQQGGAKTVIIPRGVSEWDHREGGYKVRRVYQIETEEGIFFASIPTTGNESRTKEFEGRVWSVLPMPNEMTVVQRHLSPVGQRVTEFRKHTRDYLDEWGKKLQLTSFESAYLDTQGKLQEDRLVKQIIYGLFLSNIASATLPDGGPGVMAARLAVGVDREVARRATWSEYEKLFAQGGLLNKEGMKWDNEDAKKATEEGLRNMLRPTNEGFRLLQMIVDPVSTKRPWRLTEDQRLLLAHDAHIGFAKPGEFPPKYFAQAVIWVETQPNVLTEQQVYGSWRIKSIEIIKASDSSAGSPTPLNPGPQLMTAPGLPGGR